MYIGDCKLNDRLAYQERLEIARKNPNRRNLAKFEHELLDQRLESPLGRLAFKGIITQDQYDAGRRWHETYLKYLACIGAPLKLTGGPALDPDEPRGVGDNALPPLHVCILWTDRYNKGKTILMACGKRVFHAVNSIAVYEEPESLGDQQFTIAAAKVGLTALASGVAQQRGHRIAVRRDNLTRSG